MAKWETCEIKLVSRYLRHRLFAQYPDNIEKWQAVKSEASGDVIILETDEFVARDASHDDAAESMFRTFISTLASDGWEVMTEEHGKPKSMRRQIGEPGSVSSKGGAMVSELERLEALHKRGALSDQQYQSAVNKLVGM